MDDDGAEGVGFVAVYDDFMHEAVKECAFENGICSLKACDNALREKSDLLRGEWSLWGRSFGFDNVKLGGEFAFLRFELFEEGNNYFPS